MKRITKTVGCVLSSLFFVTAASAQDSPKALQEAFEAAIAAEDVEAVTALYLSDAHLYTPGGTVEIGSEAIAASWEAFFSGFDNFSADVKQKGEHAMSDDSHSSWGLWIMTATPVDGGEPVTWKGRFLDVSVKTEDGWRYKADHASMLAAESSTPEE